MTRETRRNSRVYTGRVPDRLLTRNGKRARTTAPQSVKTADSGVISPGPFERVVKFMETEAVQAPCEQ